MNAFAFSMLAGGVVLTLTTIIFALLWLKKRNKASFHEFGTRRKTITVADGFEIQFAQWQHPKHEEITFSQENIDLLKQYISEGDTVIDIGAHSGDTTIPMAIAAGVSGCTFALEPNPYVFKVLEENSLLNQECTNIVPLNFAATEQDGEYTFHYSDGGYCNGGFLSQIQNQRHKHNSPLVVQGKNLEDYLYQHYSDQLERLTFVKIDTEGYDRFVIRSISGLLRKHRPVLVCEVLKRLSAEERDDQYDALRESGYRIFKFSMKNYLLTDPISRDQMSNWKHFDILAIPEERVETGVAA